MVKLTALRNVICAGVALFTVAFAVGVLKAAPPETYRLTLEDLQSVESVGETVLSPDGKTFAATRAGQIVLIPATGGWPVTLTSTTGGKSGLSWSPDSMHIAFAEMGSIWSVAVVGGQPQ